MIKGTLVIVPVYNEEKFLTCFLNSIVSQTILPLSVILVDDNSTDNSAAIIKGFETKYTFIKYVYNASGVGKVQGKKVIHAFNYGLSFVDLSKYSIISKIDADLELPCNYFEMVLDCFSSDSTIGIVGGRIIEFHGEQWVSTNQANYHIRGALKSYRVSCFQDIGGLMPVLGWDGLDEMKAMYLGWGTKIVELDVKHFRPAASDYNSLDLAYNVGRSNYLNGGNLFLAFVRSFIKSVRSNNLLLGYTFFKGYFSEYSKSSPKYVDDQLASFINKFHLKRIFKF
ncbi:glycosyltransferase family 2 protein [Algoriphagus chordae]|uniref:Glycosyltransferase involved in cell wall biosynthesis n=1 Tax=Algoriphagus chordae TaxID=237019 RepID=A0A2W7RTJ4_9BACT|nr:glycosyltransferase family 2 protein [Algoriphagus chordae]PZX54195.1 glycosyltransferase involved in cell wall biosynthesis [Algoriphagus chordae]